MLREVRFQGAFNEEFKYAGDAEAYHEVHGGASGKIGFLSGGGVILLREVQSSMERRVTGSCVDCGITLT